MATSIPSYLQVPQVKAGTGSPQKPFNIGNAARNLFGRDITPGYNMTWRGPVNNARPTVKNTGFSVATAGRGVGGLDPYDGGLAGSYGGYGSAAAQQQAAAQKSILDQLSGRLNSIYGSSQEAARQAGYGIDSTLKQFGLQQRQAQQALDQKGIQNESSKRAGTQDILGMIDRGINSGARILGNANAGTSSAAGEIAKAYGNVGQREQSKVNNQYELGRNAINSEQASLAEQQRLYRDSTFRNSKEQVIGGIVQSAQAQLAELDNALRGASLPDRISIEGEKQKVRDLARNELAKYDTLLQQELDSAKGKTPDEVRAEATRLAQLGQAPAGQFKYTNETPIELQGQPAPAGGLLPVYAPKRGEDQLAPQVV